MPPQSLLCLSWVKQLSLSIKTLPNDTLNRGLGPMDGGRGPGWIKEHLYVSIRWRLQEATLGNEASFVKSREEDPSPSAFSKARRTMTWSCSFFSSCSICTEGKWTECFRVQLSRFRPKMQLLKQCALRSTCCRSILSPQRCWSSA